MTFMDDDEPVWRVAPKSVAARFVAFCIERQVIRFGEFKTKAGRMSPYFFNAGLFTDGPSLLKLADYYADRIIESGVHFDVLFGPAYKGIPLAALVVAALARKGVTVSYAYNRKEAKDHGEGGGLVGAPLKDQRVLIIDDVISAGTSVRESVLLIQAAGGIFVGVVISLDRQERGQGELSATQEIEGIYHVPVISIATLEDLTSVLEEQLTDEHDAFQVGPVLDKIRAYRDKYGAK